MPSDSNGVYSLPSGYLAITGETIQASQHNPPLEDLASAMSQRLMRTGAAPMTGPFKIVDGSSGAPSVQFSNGSSTGFYKTANGIGVSVGGTKVAEFTSSGASRMIGELIPWTLTSVPGGWVLPYGQTLSRTTYADLWITAQTEIAVGNAWFNNGDGSTTFGIADMRGRVPAGRDTMGGTSADRLTPTITSGVLGSVGGSQSTTIAKANLPNFSPGFTGSSGSVSVASTISSIVTTTAGVGLQGGGTSFSVPNGSSQVFSTGSFTPSGTVGSINGNVSQTAMNVTQPTIICNYILFAGA